MPKKHPMTPEAIKNELTNRGYQQSGLARDLGVGTSMVCQVISGKSISYRVQCHIAKAIGRPVEEVFPVNPNPTRKGRPLGRGLYDHQEMTA